MHQILITETPQTIYNRDGDAMVQSSPKPTYSITRKTSQNLGPHKVCNKNLYIIMTLIYIHATLSANTYSTNKHLHRNETECKIRDGKQHSSSRRSEKKTRSFSYIWLRNEESLSPFFICSNAVEVFIVCFSDS